MRRDSTAVQHHQRASQVQSDTCAAERAASIVYLIEPVEALSFLWCYAVATVGYLQRESVALTVELYGYPSSVGHILISVAQHVHYYLVECHAVDVGIQRFFL